MAALELTCLGQHWEWSGDLLYMTRSTGPHWSDSEQARLYVDSLGETWVDIRKIPANRYFHSEKVEAYRVFGEVYEIVERLRQQGFGHRQLAPNYHRVRQKDTGRSPTTEEM